MSIKIPASWRFALKVILPVFTVVIVALAYATYHRTEIAASWNSTFLFASQANTEALLISLWSAIGFFGVVGIVALTVGLRRPEDDIIDSRLTYLFSSRKVTEDVMAYNKEQATKLAAFCEDLSLKFFVEEVNEKNDNFKMEVEGELTIQNSFHNHEYVDDDVQLHVSADDVDGQGMLGEIMSCRIVSSLDDGPTWELPERVKLDAANPEFKRPIPMKIQPDGRAYFSYRHWAWNSAQRGYEHSTTRFCKKANATITNCTDNPLSVKFRDAHAKQDEIRLEPGETHVLVKDGCFVPEASWQINIKSDVKGVGETPGA